MKITHIMNKFLKTYIYYIKKNINNYSFYNLIFALHNDELKYFSTNNYITFNDIILVYNNCDKIEVLSINKTNNIINTYLFGEDFQSVVYIDGILTKHLEC